MFKAELSTHLLQEISDTLSFRAPKPAGLKKAHNVLTWSVIHNLTLGQQDDVIKKVKGFGSRLQERHDDRALHHMCDLAQIFYDRKGCGAVQPRRNFVHEECGHWADNHLTCQITRPPIWNFSIMMPHKQNPNFYFYSFKKTFVLKRR